MFVLTEVLLKNDGALPLEDTKKLAVLGPFADATLQLHLLTAGRRVSVDRIRCRIYGVLVCFT